MAVSEVPGKIVSKALDMGAEDVICTLSENETKQIRFANNSITASKSWSSKVLGIFMVKDKRVVATDISDLSTIDKSLEDLMKLAGVMEKSQNYLGVAKGKFDYRASDMDGRIPELLDELYEHVGEAITAALDAGAKRVAGVLYSSSGETFLSSAGGPSGSYASADIEMSLRAMADNEGSGHAVQSSNSLDDFSPASVGKEAGTLAALSQAPSMGQAGKLDVLFSPMTFANILERVADSSSAGLVDAGLSFLKDQVGKEVASPIVDLVDDCTRPGAFFAPPFDSEGTPTRRTPIIEKGVLKGYLHNTSTAKRFGTETTGNSGLVFPHAWTVHLEPGKESKDELISRVRDGLYITNVWYTRFQNYQTGDFSTIPRDAIFRIKDGQIVGSVKDIRISENMLGLLQRVKAVGNDPRQIHWWEVETPVVTPHVLVEGVNITKSTQ
jgi:PmbA protein